MIDYHFAGKAGLYREILASGFGEFRERLEPVRTSRAPADERLQGFAGAMAGLASARPFFFTMVLREVTSAGSPMDDEIMRHIMSVAGIDRKILVQGIREGAFREVNPILAHLSFAGGRILVFATTPFRERLLASGMVPRARGRSAPLSPCPAPSFGESFARHHHDLFTRGLAQRPRTAKRRSP